MYSSAEARDGNGTRGATKRELFFSRETSLNLSLLVCRGMELDWWWQLVNTGGPFSTSSITVLWLAPPGGEGPLVDNCGCMVVSFTGVGTVCGECNDGDIGECGEV